MIEIIMNEQTKKLIEFLSLPTGSLAYLIDEENRLDEIGSWDGWDEILDLS